MAQISVPLVGIEPATPCLRGGSLEGLVMIFLVNRIARKEYLAGSIPSSGTEIWAIFVLSQPSLS